MSHPLHQVGKSPCYPCISHKTPLFYVLDTWITHYKKPWPDPSLSCKNFLGMIWVHLLKKGVPHGSSFISSPEWCPPTLTIPTLASEMMPAHSWKSHCGPFPLPLLLQVCNEGCKGENWLDAPFHSLFPLWQLSIWLEVTWMGQVLLPTSCMPLSEWVCHCLGHQGWHLYTDRAITVVLCSTISKPFVDSPFPSSDSSTVRTPTMNVRPILSLKVLNFSFAVSLLDDHSTFARAT